jgi:starvation-inducible DNA-binding protein
VSHVSFFGLRDIEFITQPNIGLDTSARQSVIEILNHLLADESVLSFKTHRAEGQPGETIAPELQLLYDAQYKQINDIVIEIAERVRILGGSPLSDSEELSNAARLDGKLAVTPSIISILADHETFIRFLREDTRKCSEAYDDQGTFAILVSIMRLHEKMAWVLRSNIKNEPIHGESQEKNIKNDQ